MEFELNKTSLPYHRLMFHTTVSREESMEMIVPDTYPDISKLLDTTAICCLDTKEALEDALTLAGRIHGRILYLSEGAGEIYSLGAELDFQCGVDQEGITPDCKVVAIARVRSADTKAVNSRKLLVRVQYEVALRIYHPELLAIPCGVVSTEEVEQKMESAEGYFAIAVPEKQFQFQDQLSLSGGQAGIAEVLRVQSEVNCTEAKLIGGKLVFKGDVTLQMLYRSIEGDVLTADFVLPYSQIMDAAEADETSDFQVEVALLRWSLGNFDSDGRNLPVELELYAYAEVRTVQSVALLADAYSVRHTVNAGFSPYFFPQLVERSTRKESKRELLETGAQELAVLDLSCQLSQTSVVRTGDTLRLKATAEMTVLCVDETGAVEPLTRQIAVETEVPAAEEVEALVSCQILDRNALPAANGLELRLSVAFQMLLLRKAEWLGISSLEADETQLQEEEERPSIVLRQMIDGESLWDIAKNYQTTVSEIQQANGMEDQQVEPGVLLLIPRMR